MKLYSPLYFLPLFGVVFVSCVDEIEIRPTVESNDIRFAVSVADNASSMSRSALPGTISGCEATPLVAKSTGDSLFLHEEIVDDWISDDTQASRSNMVHSDHGMYTQFNVSAYQYDEWTAETADYKPNYFYFEGAEGSASAGYNLYTKRLWPTSGKMRFIAYAPYDASNAGAYQMANNDGTTGPYVHIEVSEDISAQQDLLVAFTEEIQCGGSRQPVNLNFKHALTCVQFVLAEDMEQSRIKKISINNVTYRGDMRFRDNMTDPTARSSADASISDSYYPWDGSRSFTLDLTEGGSKPDGLEVAPGDIITDETHSFLMFPQIVPTDAFVEITLSRKNADGTWGAEEVMFGQLAAKHWPAGKIVRYRVNKERWWQALQVTALPSFPPQGGDQYFSITSFDTAENGTIKPIKWTAKYEDPANPGTFIDTPPDWYSFDATNDGDVTPRSIKVTAKAQVSDHTVDLNERLKSAGTYGTKANPYNLSTNAVGKTSIGTTANCYIVDRPGWYILPLVYGNGIKSGNVNSVAYHPNADTGNGALANFVNHQGNEISSPYILTDCASLKSSITASSAKVVWQDKPNLIQNANMSVDLSAFGGVGGIVFEITAADIVQGNSVIGLEVPGQTGKMMWSWHIWVTPFFRDGLDPLITETIGITNHDGDKFDLLFTNLGWCSEKPVEIFTPRTSKIQFSATTSDGRTLTKTIDVIQNSFVQYWHGRNTYYQWGRKDPFQPFLRSWEQQWYVGDNEFHYQYPTAEIFGNGTTALKERIQNPMTFHLTYEVLIAGSTTDYKPSNFQMYTNLWDATFSTAPVVNKYDPKAIEPVVVPARDNVKTVYDPCPPGYKVPPITTFTGFTNTGNDIGELVDSPKNWNGTLSQYSYDCAGGITEPYVYLFYTNPDKTSYIAMPLTGYRDWRTDNDGTGGAAYDMGTYGYCWTAGAASDIQGYYLELRKDAGASGLGWVMPLDYFWQLDGMPVRPCKE